VTTSPAFRTTASKIGLPNHRRLESRRADFNVFGPQYLIHDDSNPAPKVPAYSVVNMHTSYELTKNVELFGLIQNLFNQHYYQAGTFYKLGGFTNVGGGPNLYANLFSGDSRTFVPACRSPSVAAYAPHSEAHFSAPARRLLGHENPTARGHFFIVDDQVSRFPAH
jgi:hypothetical protein